MNTNILLTQGQNLFSESWTQGNLYSIQPIVNVLSTVSVWVISVVGFGIVIFSILKNALSGLYVVNPTFWDKVSDIKNQSVGLASDGVNAATSMVPGRGNAVAQRLGGFVTFLLGMIPDVRALTDFDDGVPVDKKQYFMKSIPLLVFQIFIGMFIFFGYPSKIANWIGSGGTYVVDAMINNIDPVQVVQGISDKITVYQLATDGSPLPFDKVVNQCAAEMIGTVQTRYSDMQKDPAQETAYELERFIQTALSKGGAETTLGAEEGYEISIVTSPSNGAPAIADAFKYVSQDSSYPLVRAQATNGTIQYKSWVSANTLPTGSTKVGAEDYFIWTITATPVSVSKTSSASIILCAGFDQQATQAQGKTVNFSLRGFTIGSGGTDLHGVPGAVSVDIMDASGAVLGTAGAQIQTTNLGTQSGGVPVLTFDKSQYDVVSSYIQQCAYIRISLSGTWSLDVRENPNASPITTAVSELRLKPGNNNTTYALNIWSDFGLDKASSNYTDAYAALKAGSADGSVENEVITE